MKKLIALTLSLALILCCFCGCAPAEPETPEDIVMTVDGVKVTWDEYMFWLGYSAMFLNYQYSMYGMSADWSDENLIDWCLDYAEKTITEKSVIFAKCSEMGLTLTEEDQAEIDKSMEEFKTQYCGENATDDQFEAYLKSNQNSSIAVMRNSQEATVLTNKLFAALYGEDGSDLTDDDIVSKAAEQGYTKANHILLLSSNEEGEALSEDEIAANEQKLRDLMDEMNAIEDTEARYARFLELKEEYDQDNGTEAYQFAEGVMVDEFYNTALALDPYQMDIVKSSYGYHLIIGLPLDPDYMITDQTRSGSTLRDAIANGLYTQQLAEWGEEAEIVMVGEFADFDFASTFGPEGFIYQSWADRSAAKG